MQEICEIFVAARLLTTNQIDKTTIIEVSHEAVIQKWARLNKWLQGARSDIHFQQVLSKNVAEWEQRSKPRDRLYRGTQLKEARDWTKRNIPSKREKNFLRASISQWVLQTVGIVLIFCLLLSAGGSFIWYFTNRPPDPTLVTTLKDDGTGSLRWSIAYAPSGSHIRFAPHIRGTIHLTSNDISIDKQLTIQGPAANFLAISSAGPIIDISPRATVSISNLAFKNGVFTNTSFIVSNGNLTITNSIFFGNSAQVTSYQDFGGCITNNGGSLFVTNSTFSNNSSEGSNSGAIDSENIGTVFINNSTFSNNSSQYYGGAIFSFNPVVIIGSTFLNNQALDGGAIGNFGDLTVKNSTFFNNQANDGGGAIYDYDSNLNIIYSTLYGNSASSKGGAIWIEPATDRSDQSPKAF
jgi:hypothetical protein